MRIYLVRHGETIWNTEGRIQGWKNSNLTEKGIEDAKALKIPQKALLQYKMILYQCDISSYTKDAGGLKYLEHMFEYDDGEKVFDDEDGIIAMSPEYKERYHLLKTEIYG